jgi:hypothetical protein
MIIIHTPAGKCPFKLTGTSENEVLEWAESILSSGKQKEAFYNTAALNYYAQQFYRFGTEEYKIISNIINENYTRDDYFTFMKGKIFESQSYFKGNF